MSYEVCPNCRDPLQGLVCHCGLDIREADISWCDDCSTPTVEEKLTSVVRDTGHPLHRRYRADICPDCR